jgi:hypothetical protein
MEIHTLSSTFYTGVPELAPQRKLTNADDNLYYSIFFPVSLNVIFVAIVQN